MAKGEGRSMTWTSKRSCRREAGGFACGCRLSWARLLGNGRVGRAWLCSRDDASLYGRGAAFRVDLHEHVHADGPCDFPSRPSTRKTCSVQGSVRGRCRRWSDGAALPADPIAFPRGIGVLRDGEHLGAADVASGHKRLPSEIYGSYLDRSSARRSRPPSSRQRFHAVRCAGGGIPVLLAPSSRHNLQAPQAPLQAKPPRPSV